MFLSATSVYHWVKRASQWVFHDYFLQLCQSWRQYWFNQNASISLGMVRIALGICGFWTFQKRVTPDVLTWLQSFDPGSYEPTGLLALFGPHVPSAAFVNLIQGITCYGSITGDCWFIHPS